MLVNAAPHVGPTYAHATCEGGFYELSSASLRATLTYSKDTSTVGWTSMWSGIKKHCKQTLMQMSSSSYFIGYCDWFHADVSHEKRFIFIGQ